MTVILIHRLNHFVQVNANAKPSEANHNNIESTPQKTLLPSIASVLSILDCLITCCTCAKRSFFTWSGVSSGSSDAGVPGRFAEIEITEIKTLNLVYGELLNLEPDVA